MISDINISQVDGLRRIELNRPAALNAWTPEIGRSLLDAIRDASEDEEVRAILFTGAGRAFCAGADLSVPRESMPGGEPDLSTRLREIYNPVVLAVANAPKPVIAAVHGAAAGLGASLALACDLIVCAESAYFLLAFVRLGLIPDAGSASMLAIRVGYGRAAELAMLGERLPASRALEWGVVNEVYPDADFEARAVAFAARLAAGPTVALGNMKRVLRAGLHPGLEAQLGLEAAMQQVNATTLDYPEGLAAFNEKRTPRFKGR